MAPLGVVPLGIVLAKVTAAALLAHQRRTCHQIGNEERVIDLDSASQRLDAVDRHLWQPLCAQIGDRLDGRS